MRIIRKFDLIGAFLPVIVKSGEQKIATVTSFESVKDIPVKSVTNIEIKLEFFSTKLTATENSILLVEQPKLVRMLSLFMIVSLCVLKLVWGNNEILDYLLLVFPVLYLLTMGFYWLFRRHEFLQITDIS